ncbi:MAG: hypothetical protein K0A98_01505 [Trueperaceae bacterium]|nr:hypothetical protein [Trueperaceae bacterium]
MAAAGGDHPTNPGGVEQPQGCGHRTVRMGEPADLDCLLALREARAWRDDAPAGAPGGFLLGSDRAQYREHVAHGRVMVSLAADGGIDAFSVVLDDDAFRASELWEQRGHADVPAELVARFELARLAYFDQLVARPGRAWGSARLAFHHMVDAMRRHDALLATTVVEPVANGAALPFLREVGFEVVGHVSETYPRIGRLCSAVHLLTRDVFERRMARPDARRFGALVGAGEGDAHDLSKGRRARRPGTPMA